MNIIETPLIIESKTSGYKKNKSISYSFMETSHCLCLNEREIMLAQIQVYEHLLNHLSEEIGLISLNKEILNLKLSLDLCFTKMIIIK